MLSSSEASKTAENTACRSAVSRQRGKNSTHFEITLLRFCVSRIIGILLLLTSFSYYVFAHGACTAFDSDIAKCEILNSHTDPCSSAPNHDESNKSDTSVHTCGCASVFTPMINQIVFNVSSPNYYGFFNLDLIAREFIQRIERPPISQS